MTYFSFFEEFQIPSTQIHFGCKVDEGRIGQLDVSKQTSVTLYLSVPCMYFH